MVNLRSLLAALLALLLMVPAACAEGEIAEDLAGGFDGVDGSTAEDTVAAEETAQSDIFDAELLVGYVAGSDAKINPFLCNEQDLVSMNQLVFEPLVTLDENQKPSPMLADNWEHQDKLWKFTLRSGISFHNGQPLTAYDVQASYELFVQMDSDSNPYTARMKQLISRLQAIDDRTVAVEGKYAGYITLYAMNFPVVQADTLYDDMPRGTGPYWYVRYDVDSAIRIEANPLWWQQPPTLDSITFRRYSVSGRAIEGIQTHQVDILSTRSTNAALCRKLSDLTAMDYGTTTYEMLVPNLDASSQMSNVKLRQAVMYAIDRSTIASNAYHDMAVQSEVPVLPGTWLYESQSAQYYYSPERALQLLYESGWKDLTGDMVLDKVEGVKVSELELNIITSNDSVSSIRENAVDQIAEYLNAVGIKTVVEVLEKSELKKRMSNGQYDLALIGVNLSEVPLLVQLLGSGGTLNYNAYSDSVMDTLLQQTLTADSESGMQQVYSQIQLRVVENLPIMGLLFRSGTVLSVRSLGGLKGIRALNAFRGLEYLSE